jgi:hypothetical protein
VDFVIGKTQLFWRYIHRVRLVYDLLVAAIFRKRYLGRTTGKVTHKEYALLPH